MSRVTKTLEPLPQINSDQMAFPWMSFAEDSPAKTSVTPEKAQGLRAQDQDYGAKSPAWLASYDRNTSSWKMSQHSLVEGLDEFSETWPRSGMMRNGIAYQLPPLALRTYGTGFGSSPTHSIPTPTAQDHIERQSTSTSVLNYETNKSVSLDRFAKMWPTPQARDYRSGDHPDNKRAQRKREQGWSMNLNDAVLKRKLWTTTSASDASRGGTITANMTGTSLAQQVKTPQYWPTPKTRDWKDGASAGTFQRQSPDLGKVVGQSTTTGALNPTWVEWLMGFPLGWTVSKAWETRSSRKSQKSLVEQS
jgi:hypothetical protein